MLLSKFKCSHPSDSLLVINILCPNQIFSRPSSRNQRTENKLNSCQNVIQLQIPASKLLSDRALFLCWPDRSSSIFSIHCPPATYVIPYQHILYPGPIYNILNTSTNHSGYIWTMDGLRLSSVRWGLRRGFRAPRVQCESSGGAVAGQLTASWEWRVGLAVFRCSPANVSSLP